MERGGKGEMRKGKGERKGRGGRKRGGEEEPSLLIKNRFRAVVLFVCWCRKKGTEKVVIFYSFTVF